MFEIYAMSVLLAAVAHALDEPRRRQSIDPIDPHRRLESFAGAPLLATLVACGSEYELGPTARTSDTGEPTDTAWRDTGDTGGSPPCGHGDLSSNLDGASWSWSGTDATAGFSLLGSGRICQAYTSDPAVSVWLEDERGRVRRPPVQVSSAEVDNPGPIDTEWSVRVRVDGQPREDVLVTVGPWTALLRVGR